jgi:hypothetical protein
MWGGMDVAGWRRCCPSLLPKSLHPHQPTLLLAPSLPTHHCHAHRAIGAEVLIDDNPAYAVECAQAGIHVLLYDWNHGYPWSKTEQGPVHDRITRCVLKPG